MNEAQQIQQAPAEAAGFDITSLDVVAQASIAHEFELKDPVGNSYPHGGIFLSVIGRNSDPVNDYYTRQVNAYIQRQDMATRKGKKAEPKSAETLREENISGAAIRVVGWRGIKQIFTSDLLKGALRRNPHWIEQIIEESDDVGNFTPKVSGS